MSPSSSFRAVQGFSPGRKGGVQLVSPVCLLNQYLSPSSVTAATHSGEPSLDRSMGAATAVFKTDLNFVLNIFVVSFCSFHFCVASKYSAADRTAVKIRTYMHSLVFCYKSEGLRVC